MQLDVQRLSNLASKEMQKNLEGFVWRLQQLVLKRVKIHSLIHQKSLNKISKKFRGENHTQNTLLATAWQRLDRMVTSVRTRWELHKPSTCDRVGRTCPASEKIYACDFPIAHRAGACPQLQNICVYVAEMKMSCRITVHHLIECDMTNM